MEQGITYEIEFSEEFLKHIELHRKAGQKSLLLKIDKLIDELREHPYIGTGQVEQLKYGYMGFFSRRIDKKHRLIYSVNDEKITVLVVSAFGHYTDK